MSLLTSGKVCGPQFHYKIPWKPWALLLSAAMAQGLLNLLYGWDISQWAMGVPAWSSVRGSAGREGPWLAELGAVPRLLDICQPQLWRLEHSSALQSFSLLRWRKIRSEGKRGNEPGRSLILILVCS